MRKVVLDPVGHVLLDDLQTGALGEGELVVRLVLDQLGKALVLDARRVDEQFAQRLRKRRFLRLFAAGTAAYGDAPGESGEAGVGFGRRRRVGRRGVE